MRLFSRSVTVLLLLITVLTIIGMSCSYLNGRETGATDKQPFYPERVVTVRIVAEEEDWEFLQKYALAEQYIKADLWYDGELIPDVAVRTKGNSSLMTTAKLGSPRFSLKVDFNFFNSARNLYGVRKICLNNGFSDPTLMREVLSYELFAQMGIPTPRAAFVDLWANDTHLGLYTMVEPIDKAFISNNFANNTGNLFKPEMPAAYLNWTEADYEKQQARLGASDNQSDSRMDLADINLGGGKLMEILQALEPRETVTEEDISPFPLNAPQGIAPPGGMPRNQQVSLIERMGLKTNNNKPDHSLLFRFLDILNNEPDETFPAEIEKVLDVDEVLRFLAVSALIVHLDNYIAMGHNYYLYDNNGRFAILPWDLNMAFGTFNFGLNRNQLLNYYIDEPTGGPMAERPLVKRLLSHQPYLDAYHGYLEELLDGSFSVDNMNSRIDGLAALIRPYVQADELKFFPTDQFEMGLTADARGGAPGAGPRSIGLKTFVVERSKSVREQLEGTRESSHGDGSGNRGSFRQGALPNLPPRPRQLPRERR